MVYYKLILDERRCKDDQIYPVIIRITHNRKNSSIATGIRVKKSNWNSTSFLVERSDPNFQYLNQSISEFYLKVQKIIHVLEAENKFSFEALKDNITPKLKEAPVEININFKSFSDQLVTELFSINKAGNALVYRTATNRLMEFCNNPDLKFTELDFKLLNGFKTHLIKNKIKQNSISNYFRTLRAIYNKAIKVKLVDRSHYPFIDIPIKIERTAKRAISINDLIKIKKLDLKIMSQESKTRACFLLSFTLRGASFTDLAYLKKENIRKGYLIYKRRKTGKELKIQLLPFTTQLLDLFNDKASRYLLPIMPENTQEDSLQAKKVIFQWIKTTNKYLKRISDRCEFEDAITTYVTRHTWATTAKKLGYSNEIIAEALGHEYGNKITNTYLDDFDQSVIDEVKRKSDKFDKLLIIKSCSCRVGFSFI